MGWLWVKMQGNTSRTSSSGQWHERIWPSPCGRGTWDDHGGKPKRSRRVVPLGWRRGGLQAGNRGRHCGIVPKIRKVDRHCKEFFGMLCVIDSVGSTFDVTSQDGGGLVASGFETPCPGCASDFVACCPAIGPARPQTLVWGKASEPVTVPYQTPPHHESERKHLLNPKHRTMMSQRSRETKGCTAPL